MKIAQFWDWDWCTGLQCLICVQHSWKKLYLKILMRETCLGLFNIEVFYQNCNFGGFWWIFKNIKPACCTYQNLCMTFLNILGFSSTFQHHAKFMVNSNDLRNNFFLIFDLTSWFVTQGQKEGGISFGPWNHDRWLSQQRTHKFEYVYRCCWTNQEFKQ